MPYLPVIGLSPKHLRSHPESRAHQRQLPLHILHRQLRHLPGQPEVRHQRLAAPRSQADEAVLKGVHGARHEMPGEEERAWTSVSSISPALSPTSLLQLSPASWQHMECTGHIRDGPITSEARKSPLKMLFNEHDDPHPFI